MLAIKPAFYDADADTDILATILARMSVSASWNAGFTDHCDGQTRGAACTWL